MKCSSCSAEIADKAIVCYRCGAPTAFAVPVRPKKRARQSRARLLALLLVLAVMLGLLAFTYMKWM